MKYSMNSLSFSPFENFDIYDFYKSLIIATALFLLVAMGVQTYASTVTLSVVVNTSLTFSSSTDNFTAITPGTGVYATTTLSVLTNDTAGYNITLSGDNKSTGNHNLQLSGNSSVQITDQTEWVPAAATSSVGNGTLIASLANSGNVLAFRVMSASSTNGTVFLSTSWWGSNDSPASALWGGIPSSTVARRIGNAGSGSYSSAAHLNTVLYYLNVSASQQTGTYNAPITYTATGN